MLVIGLGRAGKVRRRQYLKAVGDAARALRTGPAKSALFTLAEVAVKDRDAAWNMRSAAIAADHACYRYLATLGEKNKREERAWCVSRFRVPDQAALAQGIAIAAGVQFTRELGNLPPNVCKPRLHRATGAAQRFEAATRSNAKCWTTRRWTALGMGSLLAVARGSAQPARAWWC